MTSLYAVLRGVQMTFRFRLGFHGQEPMMHMQKPEWKKKKSKTLQIRSRQQVQWDEVDQETIPNELHSLLILQLLCQVKGQT